MTRIAIAFGVLWFGIIGTSAVQAQTGVRAKDPALQAAIEARQKAVDMRNAADYGKYSSDFHSAQRRRITESPHTRLGPSGQRLEGGVRTGHSDSRQVD